MLGVERSRLDLADWIFVDGGSFDPLEERRLKFQWMDPIDSSDTAANEYCSTISLILVP